MGRGEEKEIRVERAEGYAGISGGPTKFGCYVLVETFALRRMDGSLALSYTCRPRTWHGSPYLENKT